MKIMITGGAGFLGAWIIRSLLALGHDVRVFDRRDERTVLRQIVGPAANDLDWMIGDVANPQDVLTAASGCDATIHLAGLLTPACKADPLLGANVNLIGTLNVFEAAKRLGQKQVAYASSAGVFGPDDGTDPYPMTLYGVYKFAGEGAARVYAEDYGIASVGFRPLVVYGPGREIGSSAGPTLACQAAAEGRPFSIGFTGMTNLIYVEDVAAAFVAAATRTIDGAHVFNLRGEDASIDQVMDAIKTIAPDAQLSAAGDPLPITHDIEAHDMQPVLGPLPFTALKPGLKKTYDFYAERALA